MHYFQTSRFSISMLILSEIFIQLNHIVMPVEARRPVIMRYRVYSASVCEHARLIYFGLVYNNSITDSAHSYILLHPVKHAS